MGISLWATFKTGISPVREITTFFTAIISKEIINWAKEQATESWNLTTALFTRVVGRMTRLMVLVRCNTLMKIFMKAIFSTEKNKDRASTTLLTVIYIKVTGRMIRRMD
jgi:hypothetical protein